MKIEFVDTFVVTAAENSFPMLTTLPSYATREPAGPYNRNPFIFSRGSCFRCDPRNAETRAKVNAEAVPSASRKGHGTTFTRSLLTWQPANRIKADPPEAIPILPSKHHFPSFFLSLSPSLFPSLSLSLSRSLRPSSPRTFCAQHSRQRIGRECFSIGSWKNWRER